MALAQKKQNEILKAVLDIEAHLVKKYKISNEGTFGSKLKEAGPKIKNELVKDSMWQILKMRNAIVHPGNLNITSKEYELFISLFTYVKKIEKF